ncbi:hypothetical protein PR048_012160 [Dryococelus australis]|uniref:Uncharacterized protein n=1 Tax=Dryococelus australis TaxID=614101 RepID=A0ABQ9HP86_9NEOP|nr:hypothetical protein PR048_012160 [Dryococelus australis]
MTGVLQNMRNHGRWCANPEAGSNTDIAFAWAMLLADATGIKVVHNKPIEARVLWFIGRDLTTPAPSLPVLPNFLVIPRNSCDLKQASKFLDDGQRPCKDCRGLVAGSLRISLRAECGTRDIGEKDGRRRKTTRQGERCVRGVNGREDVKPVHASSISAESNDEHVTRNEIISLSSPPTLVLEASVAERLVCSPPTKSNRALSPAGDRARWNQHVEIVPDDAADLRLFSGISRFFRPFILALLNTHLNHPHRLPRPRWGRDGAMLRLLAFHEKELRSNPGRAAPDFRVWESCRTMPLVSGSSRESPVSPALAFRLCSIPHLDSSSSALNTSLLRAA